MGKEPTDVRVGKVHPSPPHKTFFCSRESGFERLKKTFFQSPRKMSKWGRETKKKCFLEGETAKIRLNWFARGEKDERVEK